MMCFEVTRTFDKKQTTIQNIKNNINNAFKYNIFSKTHNTLCVS
jgi:hypothetical protein